MLNYLAWGVLFVSMLVFHRAQPEFETFFDRFYLLDIRTEWDRQFLNYLGYVMGTGFAISLFGLCLSLYRARRKTDHKNNLIILGCLYLFLLLLAWFLW